MLKIIILLVSLSINCFASVTVELYADCSNYCAFRDIKNNCHGIAFKKTNGEKIDFLYTHISKDEKFCVYDRFLANHIISMGEVKQKCDCANYPELPPAPDHTQKMSEETRHELSELRNQIASWAPCAENPLTMPVPANDQEPYLPKDVKACRDMEDGYMVLGGCKKGTFWNYCDYYGNTNNVAGPFCVAGDMDRCHDIKINQDPETGAWYRSAFQRRFPLSEHGQPLFSRDEFLGIMLYLAKTKDKVAALKWMRFLDNNPRKFMFGSGKLIKVFNMCPPFPVEQKPVDISDEDWKKMQPDDRCELRGDTWALMYKTYKYIGFTDKELRKISKKIHNRMLTFSVTAPITSNISSRFTNAYTYETGLQATTVLLLRAVGMENNSLLNESAKIINTRTGFENPYYHYLAMGNKATEYGAHLIKKYCLPTEPDFVHPPQGGIGVPAASFFDSSAHYFMGLKDNWQANLPIGHDCIGWIDFYLNAK